MILNQSFTVGNRKQAGLLLAERLIRFKNSDAVVIGVTYGGALVGYHLAAALNLSFDVIGCKAIKHPADPRRSIGSISADQVVIHEESHDIPSDYIYRQILLNQDALKARQAIYHSGTPDRTKIANTDILVVGDVVTNADSIIASIRTLRTQKPKQIIVAASMVSPEAVRKLQPEVDSIVSLLEEADVWPGGFYDENPNVRDEDIKNLLLKPPQIDRTLRNPCPLNLCT